MKLGAYYCIFYPIFVTLLLLQFSLNFSHSCSPRGGGGLSRRRSRKPLVLGQAVPNIEETSIRASGKPSGKITRNSSKFNSLVTCYSTDIVFKDEEGTGADRIMSKVKIHSLVYISYLVFHRNLTLSMNTPCVVYLHSK